MMVLPTVLATENNIINASGNLSGDVAFSLSTVQTSVNPIIGANISYTTIVNVTHVEDVGHFNLTGFDFYLPDNSTTNLSTDFVFLNASNDQKNATSFNMGARNYVHFDLIGHMNISLNGTVFNITWKLNQPIASTKLTTTTAGRTYTETWNITSSASNITIQNASLLVTPTYWYTRIGNPTSTLFNSTTKSYAANITDIRVYTDLNLSSNLESYGSGWSTLSITYNGPSVDSSSGSSSSDQATTPVVSPIRDWFQLKNVLFVLVGLVVLAGIAGIVVVLVKKKK